jgi:hypothetical protein
MENYNKSRFMFSILFWSVLAAYCINLIDESLMGGGFVAGMQNHFWPAYKPIQFFFLNFSFIIFIFISNLLYDLLGDKYVVFPLFWLWERSINGIWHIWWSINFVEYSPGLLTSLLFWILLYFMFKLKKINDFPKKKTIIVTGTIAFIFECIFLSFTFIASNL